MKPAVLLLNLLASQKLIWVEIQEKSIGYTFSDADSVVTAIKKNEDPHNSDLNITGISFSGERSM